jgi:spore germination cell wall hydrolase CwlJ-like protein
MCRKCIYLCLTSFVFLFVVAFPSKPVTRQSIAGATQSGASDIVASIPVPRPAGDSDERAGRAAAATARWTATPVAYGVPDDLSRQIECLALNIYWESKSEPILGQVAVAAVTLNRLMHPQFPKTVCDVVRQGNEGRRHQCHFSWWCDGRDDAPREQKAWRQALTLASSALVFGLPDPTRGALWYHADYVYPDWASAKKVVARIGRHIFYVQPSRKRWTESAGL